MITDKVKIFTAASSNSKPFLNSYAVGMHRQLFSPVPTKQDVKLIIHTQYNYIMSNKKEMAGGEMHALGLLPYWKVLTHQQKQMQEKYTT